MAGFLSGVVVSWVVTFALWLIWSFGFVPSLLLGALAGTVAMFALLLTQGVPQMLFGAPRPNDILVKEPLRSDREKSAFRS